MAARLSAEFDADLDHLIAAHGRAKSWLVIDAVAEGKRALREGRTVEHATVAAAFEQLFGKMPN